MAQEYSIEVSTGFQFAEISSNGDPTKIISNHNGFKQIRFHKSIFSNKLNTFELGIGLDYLGFYHEFEIQTNSKSLKGGNGLGLRSPVMVFNYSFKLYEKSQKSIAVHFALPISFNKLNLQNSYSALDTNFKPIGTVEIDTKLSSVFFSAGIGYKLKFNKKDFIEFITTSQYCLINGYYVRETFTSSTSVITIKPSQFIVSVNFKYYFH